LATKGQL